MTMSSSDSLARLAAVIESRKPANGADPDASYVARLLQRGPDAFLKKIGEEATEVVMAAKDAEHGGDRRRLVGEVADLWFHTMIALAHYGLAPADVIAAARYVAPPLTEEGAGDVIARLALGTIQEARAAARAFEDAAAALRERQPAVASAR